MKPRAVTIFDRNPKKTLLIVWLVFILTFEIGFKLYVNSKDTIPINPFDQAIAPGAEISDDLTHHGIPPNSKKLTKPNPHDTFEPVTNVYNSLGIRGTEIGPKLTPRVFFVGDSFIEADEVIFDKTFSELLNREFQGKIQFIAHGVSSWSPTTEFSWIHNKGMLLEPGEIYLFLVWNDFYPEEVYSRGDETYRDQAVWENNIPVRYLSTIDRELAEQPKTYLLRKRIYLLLGKSELAKFVKTGYKLLKKIIFPPMTEQDSVIFFSLEANRWPKKLRENVDETIDVVEKLNTYLQARDIEFYVTLVPNGLAWKDELLGVKKFNPEWVEIVSKSGLLPREFSVSYEGLEQYLSNQLTSKDISWFSLTQAFDNAKINGSRLLYNEEDGHWNWRGHEVLFEYFKNHFQESIIAPIN